MNRPVQPQAHVAEICRDGIDLLRIVVPEDSEAMREMWCSAHETPATGTLTITASRAEIKRILLIAQKYPDIRSIGIMADIQAEHMAIEAPFSALNVYPSIHTNWCLEAAFSDSKGNTYSLMPDVALLQPDIRALLKRNMADARTRALTDLMWLYAGYVGRVTNPVPDLMEDEVAAWLYDRHRDAILDWMVDAYENPVERLDYRLDVLLDKPESARTTSVQAWAQALLRDAFVSSSVASDPED